MTTEWVTTSRLLEQLRGFDNHSAWNLFGGWFRQPVVAFARRMGLEGADADDAAQETLVAFAHAYREGRYDSAKGRLSEWLFGIAYRQIQNSRRKIARHNRAVVAGAPSSMLSQLPDRAAASRPWDEEWQQAVLRASLERVRAEVEEKTYRAFHGVVFEKKPAAVVAEELGMSRNAVFQARHRITRRIRELKADVEEIE